LTTFFAWYTHPNSYEKISEYKDDLQKTIFACIELSKQQYDVIMNMPVKRFYDLMKWKSDLEDEKKRQINENEGRINTRRTH